MVCKAALCLLYSGSTRKAALLTVTTLLFAQDAKRALCVSVSGASASVDIATTVLSLDFSLFCCHFPYRLLVLQSNLHYHLLHVDRLGLGQ